MIFRHSCLIVKDLAKSVEFYQKYFDLKLINVDTLSKEHSETLTGIKGAIVKYAKFNDDVGGILELIESNIALKPHISLTVKDIDALYRTLKYDVTFLSPPFDAPDSDARVCWCADNDNIIELVEKPRKA